MPSAHDKETVEIRDGVCAITQCELELKWGGGTIAFPSAVSPTLKLSPGNHINWISTDVVTVAIATIQKQKATNLGNDLQLKKKKSNFAGRLLSVLLIMIRMMTLYLSSMYV